MWSCYSFISRLPIDFPLSMCGHMIAYYTSSTLGLLRLRLKRHCSFYRIHLNTSNAWSPEPPCKKSDSSEVAILWGNQCDMERLHRDAPVLVLVCVIQPGYQTCQISKQILRWFQSPAIKPLLGFDSFHWGDQRLWSIDKSFPTLSCLNSWPTESMSTHSVELYLSPELLEESNS